ncbi:MAG: tRNA-dihydrouridine synthase, partial [Candidatus Anstonellaceae archaeon]
ARIIEDAGACGITVHWRTACEGRKRNIGWESVTEVKRSVQIPVIGNGGAYSPQLAVRFLEEAQCDAVMISSAALGNPRIFSRANALLQGKPMEEDGWEKRQEDFAEYMKLAKNYGILNPKSLRAHAIEFAKFYHGAKALRKRLNDAKSLEEIANAVFEFKPLHSSSSDMKI